MGDREQLWGASYAFAHVGFQLLNSDHHAGWQVPLLLEPHLLLSKIHSPNQLFPTWEYQNQSKDMIFLSVWTKSHQEHVV